MDILVYHVPVGIRHFSACRITALKITSYVHSKRRTSSLLMSTRNRTVVMPQAPQLLKQTIEAHPSCHYCDLPVSIKSARAGDGLMGTPIVAVDE